MGLVGFGHILPWYTPSPERAPRTPSTPRDPSRPMRRWRVALRALAGQLPSSLELAGCPKSCPRVFKGCPPQLLPAATAPNTPELTLPPLLFQTPELSKCLVHSWIVLTEQFITHILVLLCSEATTLRFWFLKTKIYSIYLGALLHMSAPCCKLHHKKISHTWPLAP